MRLAYREENDGISSGLESGCFVDVNLVEVLCAHLYLPNGYSCETVIECYQPDLKWI